MKHIRSTVEVITNATKPNETSIVIFKDFNNSQDVELGRGTFTFNSYKVVPGDPEVHESIDSHRKEMDSAEMDAMLVAIQPIAASTYTARQAEEDLKGAKKVIDAEGFFGLTEAQLVIE